MPDHLARDTDSQPLSEQIGFEIVLFYDRPKLPRGLYDDLLKLPHSVRQIIKRRFCSCLSLPIRER
jgi:hypothetical protein